MRPSKTQTRKEVNLMNANELKSCMVLHGDNMAILADYLGITDQSLRNKMRPDGTEFKQTEIARIAARYSLTPDQTMRIFFAQDAS